MDLLFATVRLDERCAIAVITANSPGLTVRPFWKSDILAGAESDEVILQDVLVPKRLVSDIGPIGVTTEALRRSLVWFEILISASYLGMAAALVERVLTAPRATTDRMGELAIRLEGATYALEGVAARSDSTNSPEELLGPALIARFTTQEAVVAAAALATEILGGGAFISRPEISYLYAATRCLAFHPPAREVGATAMAGYLRGTRGDVE
jgi:alkylation response protein AidB-like acyl-CoA dehydrogenase